MLNQTIIIGNLGRDPVMRYLPDGTPVVQFSLGSNRKYTNAEGAEVKETTWFQVSVWGKQAEACNTHLHKGSKVFIQGRLTPDRKTGVPRIWTRTDGTVGTSYEITASLVRFLSPSEHEPESDHAAAPADEEIPF